MKEKALIASAIVMFAGIIFITFSDIGYAEQPDVITVDTMDEALYLTPYKGVIQRISFEDLEIVIGDAQFTLSPTVRFYSEERRPARQEKFNIGTVVGAYFNDDKSIKSLYLRSEQAQAEPSPENGVENTESQGTQPSSAPARGGIYLENGVYRN